MKDASTNRELSSSDPLNKSILDSFRYIKGRKYHNQTNATYFFPNDEKEVARLNIQHNLFGFIWPSNFSSPVHELLKSGTARVLDIGCGTGQWLLDMAHEYPQVTFVGVDMSPMFPDAKNTPSNVFFLQLNLNDGLPFPDETFDFVNQRFLCNNVVFEQWKFYVKEMIRVTKSGGWLEFYEFDVDYQNASSYGTRAMKLLHSEFESKGINPRPETCVPQYLQSCQELSKIQFDEMHLTKRNLPEQLEAMVKMYVSMNAETMKLLITSNGVISDETYEILLGKSMRDFLDYKIYFKLFRWYSKKKL